MSYSRSCIAAALFVLAVTHVPAAAAPASAGDHTRSAATAASLGPTRGAVLSSKYVARHIFKTRCRLVHVVVRRQTPDPSYVGQAMAPCRIVIRRGHYSFVRICALIVHEYGHLAGFDHSTDPNDIMHPARPARYPPCVRHAAFMRRRAAAKRANHRNEV